MRLHPVISFVARRLTAPTQIAGYRLPAGVTVMPAILLAHADPDAYPHPERFDPDRFVGESPPPNTWIPFGGGTRRCLGAGFALLEGTAVLRAVLRRWELQPVRPARERPRIRNITAVPGGGATIAVHPRSRHDRPEAQVPTAAVVRTVTR